MPNSPETQDESSLAQIHMISNAYMNSRCLMTAVQHDVFSRIAEGNRTTEKIARAAGISERGTRPLLDTLTALGLLRKKNGRYALTQAADRHLVKGRPEYMGATLETDRLWDAWTHLPEAVKTGEPYRKVESQEQAEAFFPALIRTLHVGHSQTARNVARALASSVRARPLRALDVACGSGVWGISLMEERDDARVTFHDFPGIFDVTREYVKQHGVEDRAEWLPGDLKEADYGESAFDVAILGNIVHTEGEASSRDLFKRVYRALSPDGRIAVIDMLPREDRTGPLMPVRFALLMLLESERGGTYTLSEYTEWLESAGFTDVETVPIQSHSPMIVARKP